MRLSENIKLLGCDSIRMTKIAEFITSFCLGRLITQNDIDSLSLCEKLIFTAVLVKKRYRNVHKFDFSLESVRAFMTKCCERVNQEHYKHILRGLIKTLKKNYLDRFPWLKASDFSVYEQFFHDTNHDLDEARARKYTKNFSVLFASHKRDELVKLCKSSADFMRYFNEYLSDQLLFGNLKVGVKSEAFDNILHKVPKLIAHWQNLLYEKKHKQAHWAIAEFIVGFLNNKYVKLPWTTYEVKQAVQLVKRLFDVDKKMSIQL